MNPEQPADAIIPETILIVDDNPEVLRTVVAIVERAGFKVLSARCGEDAITLARETPGEIHLLLSDVDMPLMSGPELGDLLKATRPKIHVMFMSGGGVDGNLLVLNYGWAFIEKPFLVNKLVRMITEVLRTPDRSQPGGREFDSRADKGKNSY
ncbi:MAG: response regulator [Terriglobia bacterium]